MYNPGSKTKFDDSPDGAKKWKYLPSTWYIFVMHTYAILSKNRHTATLIIAENNYNDVTDDINDDSLKIY